jgi:hypothetical protein
MDPLHFDPRLCERSFENRLEVRLWQDDDVRARPGKLREVDLLAPRGRFVDRNPLDDATRPDAALGETETVEQPQSRRVKHEGVAVRRGALSRVVDRNLDTGELQRERGKKPDRPCPDDDHFGFPLAEHVPTSNERVSFPAPLAPQ